MTHTVFSHGDYIEHGDRRSLSPRETHRYASMHARTGPTRAALCSADFAGLLKQLYSRRCVSNGVTAPTSQRYEGHLQHEGHRAG